jgi:hypothetical protein
MLLLGRFDGNHQHRFADWVNGFQQGREFNVPCPCIADTPTADSDDYSIGGGDDAAGSVGFDLLQLRFKCRPISNE